MGINNGREKDLELIERVVVIKKVQLLDDEKAEEVTVPLELIPSKKEEAWVPIIGIFMGLEMSDLGSSKRCKSDPPHDDRHVSFLVAYMKSKNFDWGDEHENAFQTLKESAGFQKGIDEMIELRSDGSLYFLDRIWVSLKGDVRTLIIDEAYESKYSVHPGVNKMYCDLRDRN
nr:putative reverse transcriptase domain-containing protein [Tanacetum cinerariifolium]